MTSTKAPSGVLRTLVVVALIGIATYKVVSGVLLKKVGVPGLFTLEFDTATRHSKATAPPSEPPPAAPPGPPSAPPTASREGPNEPPRVIPLKATDADYELWVFPRFYTWAFADTKKLMYATDQDLFAYLNMPGHCCPN